MFLPILISTLAISGGALLGLFTISLNQKRLNKFLMYLVSFSAGTLTGGAFLHLLPEASESLEPITMYSIVLLSYVFFFLIETILHWHHCHDEDCKTHSFGYMNLIGDSIHNFIDGMIIATAFLVDFKVGISTALAIAIHEIPQEIGDFAVLLHAGFEKRKALLLNFGVALTIVLGGVAGYLLSSQVENLVKNLVPFAAGGFIYIATSDLVPQIKTEKTLKKSLKNLIVFVCGIMVMAALKFVF